MNRRGFIGSLTGFLAAAATLDPERLLWTPGAKTIFIPPVQQIVAPRLMVGIATSAIRAGNYGFVQIYGPVNYPRANGKHETLGAVHRRVQALKDVMPGDVVFSDDVDYGNAPLWITANTPEVIDGRMFGKINMTGGPYGPGDVFDVQ